jgi:F1F0 ATPase subunit 2
MTMADVLALLEALIAGIGLGALFFGGLFWSLRKGLSARIPALWMFASLVLRTSIVLAGFYVVGHGDWHRLLGCLVGFTVARIAAMQLTRRGAALRRQAEAAHASEP